MPAAFISPFETIICVVVQAFIESIAKVIDVRLYRLDVVHVSFVSYSITFISTLIHTHTHIHVCRCLNYKAHKLTENWVFDLIRSKPSAIDFGSGFVFFFNCLAVPQIKTVFFYFGSWFLC